MFWVSRQKSFKITLQSIPTEVLRIGIEPAVTLLHNMDTKHFIVSKQGTCALSFERPQMEDHENKFIANEIFSLLPNFEIFPSVVQ